MITSILFRSIAEVHAITWDLDEDGNSQGWLAQVGFASGAYKARLHSEVGEGIWRVRPSAFEAGFNPVIELVSPLLGHDSSLFDRMTIRFRLVHTEPV